MEFRPCIDIHNGAVKQIVGSTLDDAGQDAVENFVSEKGGGYYGKLYKDLNLPGGHVIILNRKGSEYYEASRQQAIDALAAYPRGLMIGGGVTDENAAEYIDAGASHVIVTSFVFSNGRIDRNNLVDNLANAILDLYHQPDKRRLMAKASLERSKSFDKEIYAKEYFEAIEHGL